MSKYRVEFTNGKERIFESDTYSIARAYGTLSFQDIELDEHGILKRVKRVIAEIPVSSIQTIEKIED